MNNIDLEKQISEMRTKSLNVKWRLIFYVIFYVFSIIGAFILGGYFGSEFGLNLYEF